MAAAAPAAAVGDTWAAVGTRGAGTWTHRGRSTSSKASVPGPSSLAGTRTAAHPDAAGATPPSLFVEHVERAEQLKYRKACPDTINLAQSGARVGRAKQTRGDSRGKWKDPYHNGQNRNTHPLRLCILGPDECPCACFRKFDPSVLCEGVRH